VYVGRSAIPRQGAQIQVFRLDKLFLIKKKKLNGPIGQLAMAKYWRKKKLFFSSKFDQS
jgi:hypothetical protein